MPARKTVVPVIRSFSFDVDGNTVDCEYDGETLTVSSNDIEIECPDSEDSEDSEEEE